MRSQSGLGGQRCVIALNDDLRKLDAQLARLTKKAAPKLLARFGIGPQTATTLLISAGDNPTTLHGKSAMAALCDTSPFLASSGIFWQGSSSPAQSGRRSPGQQRGVDQ